MGVGRRSDELALFDLSPLFRRHDGLDASAFTKAEATDWSGCEDELDRLKRLASMVSTTRIKSQAAVIGSVSTFSQRHVNSVAAN